MGRLQIAPLVQFVRLEDRKRGTQFASLVSLCHTPTMQPVVVYDSVYGNTERNVRAITDAGTGKVEVLCVVAITTAERDVLDLLMVGSPTHGADPAEYGRGGRAALIWSMSATYYLVSLLFFVPSLGNREPKAFCHEFSLMTSFSCYY